MSMARQDATQGVPPDEKWTRADRLSLARQPEYAESRAPASTSATGLNTLARTPSSDLKRSSSGNATTWPSEVSTALLPCALTGCLRVKRDKSSSVMSVVLAKVCPAGSTQVTNADMPGMPVERKTNGAVQPTWRLSPMAMACLNQGR